jgi:hypothetical protein
MGAGEATSLYAIYKFLIPIFLGVISFGLILLVSQIKKMAEDIGLIKINLEKHSNKVEDIEEKMERVQKKIDDHHDIILILKNNK